jgi:site-specific DNA-cytosine methylase
MITFTDIPHMTIDVGGVAFSLTSRDYKSPPCVTEPVELSNGKDHGGMTQDGTTPTLTKEDRQMVGHSTVRRLTPLECERLQGYPDGWTDIGEWVDSKGKKHKEADSPRYKALGNSIALPFWKVLAKRISAQYDRDITMGSLFDGIGGFPLVFEQINGKGTARWASEIEEFPMAVTKLRFGED